MVGWDHPEKEEDRDREILFYFVLIICRRTFPQGFRLWRLKQVIVVFLQQIITDNAKRSREKHQMNSSLQSKHIFRCPIIAFLSVVVEAHDAKQQEV